MTDLQLILTISIPSLLVILSWIQNNTRLSRLEAALDINNRRVDESNRRIDDLQRMQHADMVNLLSEMGRLREEMSKLRERVALLETATR